MRLGLYGAGEDGAAWRAVVASAGAVLVAMPDDVAAGGPGCDAVLVVGREAGSDGGPGAPGAVAAFARSGGPVLAIGAGVEIACALGLLPGRLAERGTDPASASASHVRVEGRPTPFTSAIPAGRVLRLSAAPGPRQEWRLDLPELQARGQVIFRACDSAGGARRGAAVLGVSNPAGNVVGLLAAADTVGGEGAQLLRSLRLHLRAGR
jgi:hypothetical protein